MVNKWNDEEIERVFREAIPKKVAKAVLQGRKRVTAVSLLDKHPKGQLARSAGKGRGRTLGDILDSLYPDLEGQYELFPGRPIRLSEAMTLRMSPEFMRDVVASVIPRDLAEAVYHGCYKRVHLRPRFQRDAFGRRVWNSASFQGQRDKKSLTGALNPIINSLYPDLEERFFEETGERVPLADALRGVVRDRRIRHDLRELFESGVDLSDRGLNHHDHRLWKCLRAREVEEMLPGFGSHRSRLCSLIAEGLTPEYLLQSESGTKMIGILGEKEAELLLRTAIRYDRSLRRLSELRGFFPTPLKGLAHSAKERLATNGEYSVFADERVYTADGDVLVEVKSGRTLYPGKFFAKISKYDGVDEWVEGGHVRDRVLVLNSGKERVRSYGDTLAFDHGWKVLHAEEFAPAYEKALGILADKHPEVMREFPPELLLQFNDIVAQRSHLIGIDALKYTRQWMIDVVDRVTALVEGWSTTPPLVHRRSLRETYRTRMEDLSETYGRRSASVVPGMVFLDLETIGFRNQGGPVTIAGLAFEHDGKMIIEQHVARHPLEERQVLERTLRRLEQHDTVVTFNGEFDLGFLRDRCYANRILPNGSIPAHHVDLFPLYRRHTRRTHSQAPLQSFETSVLGFKREFDIDPEHYAELYGEYSLAESAGGVMYNIIEHNRLDMATTVLLQRYLQGKKK